MKKLLIVLAFLGLLASAVFAFYTFNLFIYNEKQGNSEPAVPYEPTLTGNTDDAMQLSESENQALIAAIENALVAKHGPNAAKLTVSVSEISNNYAKGGASGIGIGGGQWFAAKKNGLWQLVYDGNGIILCSDLQDYVDFPSSLIPQCFDENKNMLIKR